MDVTLLWHLCFKVDNMSERGEERTVLELRIDRPFVPDWQLLFAKNGKFRYPSLEDLKGGSDADNMA